MNARSPLLRSSLPWAACAFLLAAPAARSEHAVPRDTRRPDAQPQLFAIDDSNAQIRRAVHQARRTVPGFIRALRAPRPGQESFSVKKPIYQHGQVEHLWLTDLTFSGNRFHGRVDNRPRKIKGIHLGDRLSVNPDEITDWAYVDHGNLVGGFTIRALYQQLPPKRQQELQNEVVFKISHR